MAKQVTQTGVKRAGHWMHFPAAEAGTVSAGANCLAASLPAWFPGQGRSGSAGGTALAPAGLTPPSAFASITL